MGFPGVIYPYKWSHNLTYNWIQGAPCNQKKASYSSMCLQVTNSLLWRPISSRTTTSPISTGKLNGFPRRNHKQSQVYHQILIPWNQWGVRFFDSDDSEMTKHNIGRKSSTCGGSIMILSHFHWFLSERKQANKPKNENTRQGQILINTCITTSVETHQKKKHVFHDATPGDVEIILFLTSPPVSWKKVT